MSEDPTEADLSGKGVLGSCPLEGTRSVHLSLWVFLPIFMGTLPIFMGTGIRLSRWVRLYGILVEEGRDIEDFL